MLQQRAASDARVARVLFGLSWTVVELDNGACGLCFSPTGAPRDIPWAGELAGRPVSAMLDWLRSDHPCEMAAAVASVNAVLNFESFSERVSGASTPTRLLCDAAPHLAVFEHFADQLAGARVAIVGRYPGMQRFAGRFDYQCIERRPGPGDLPEDAAASVLPASDWVFVTASSIANGTAPQLLELARAARVVLMGPSLAWMPDWARFGVDYLAGVQVRDASALRQIVAEAGGTRIFRDALAYQLVRVTG
ncbi:hypothetical protein E4634_03695 [Mangrovimicrobium sediminis]|uniref:Heavy-metal chelation domain-containing protein n=1 Tax=Mangrovimicrobium sediminis TaxID=2562682 RepID=A0A4Z0M6Q4_9GAMM|nr:hypothetical protein E4634_03695 [Haliea sp. SAOS-164]